MPRDTAPAPVTGSDDAVITALREITGYEDVRVQDGFLDPNGEKPRYVPGYTIAGDGEYQFRNEVMQFCAVPAARVAAELKAPAEAEAPAKKKAGDK